MDMVPSHSLNSAPPSAEYIRHWIGSALVPILACRLFVPNHNLHQCWFNVNWTLRNNASENIVCEMAVIYCPSGVGMSWWPVLTTVFDDALYKSVMMVWSALNLLIDPTFTSAVNDIVCLSVCLFVQPFRLLSASRALFQLYIYMIYIYNR